MDCKLCIKCEAVLAKESCCGEALCHLCMKKHQCDKQKVKDAEYGIYMKLIAKQDDDVVKLASIGTVLQDRLSELNYRYETEIKENQALRQQLMDVQNEKFNMSLQLNSMQVEMIDLRHKIAELEAEMTHQEATEASESTGDASSLSVSTGVVPSLADQIEAETKESNPVVEAKAFNDKLKKKLKIQVDKGATAPQLNRSLSVKRK